MYIDSHTHFDLILEETQDSEAVLLKNMSEQKVSAAVQVSIDTSGLKWSRDFAERNRRYGILFTAGIHPSSRAAEKDLRELASFVEETDRSESRDLLFGIGECGLDYYRMRQPADMQTASFEFQADLARKHDLPVIVHSRDAWQDTVALLKRLKPEKGIMHCFPGDSAMAREALDLGFYISFAGNVTYRKAEALHDSAAYVPLDRLLVETDAPFLTPVPLRGRQNRPEYVINTYRFLSDLRNDSIENLREAVAGNFNGLRRI